MSHRRAFVIDHNSKQDVSDASRFGQIVYLFAHGERPPSLFSNAFIVECMHRMEDFDELLDYFVVSGNVNATTLVTATLVSKYDTVNLLLFDASNSEYVHKAIT